MTSRLAELREKSRKRKEYLKVTLGVDNLSEALGSDTVEPAVKRIAEVVDSKEADDGEDKAEREDREFRDSTAFLKGTQSLNPHNDYSQNFVDTGQRPQNFIRDTGEACTTGGAGKVSIVLSEGLTGRFEEYPKLQELIRLKVEPVVTIKSVRKV